jgi:PIN domain
VARGAAVRQGRTAGLVSLVLDAEAFSAVARALDKSQPTRFVGALRAAVEEGDDVLVPAAVLSEAYRGGQYDQVVDACLGRFPSFTVVATDRSLAREIGHLLARAGRGSADHVDASVVAVAIQAGGAVVATGDPDDMSALAAGLLDVRIETL